MSLKCIVEQRQGNREYQEDAYSSGIFNNGIHYLGVFDGHGGKDISNWLSENMIDALTSDISSLKHKKQYKLISKIENKLKNIYKNLDYRARSYFDKKNKTDQGSTGVIAIWDDENLFVANLGDSRCIIFDSNGSILLETKDHKPNNEKERERIAKAGGQVSKIGIARVNGTLAVSRAFGDWDLKSDTLEKSAISWDPDVYHLALEYDRNKDIKYYVLLASDGLWDIYSSKEVVDKLLLKGDCLDVSALLNRTLDDNTTVTLCEIKENKTEEIEAEIDTLIKNIEIQDLEDEDAIRSYPYSDGIINRNASIFKGVPVDDRRYINYWIETRLKDILYILGIVHLNTEKPINSDTLKTIIKLLDIPSINDDVLYDETDITVKFRTVIDNSKIPVDVYIPSNIFNTLYLLAIIIIRQSEQQKKIPKNIIIEQRKNIVDKDFEHSPLILAYSNVYNKLESSLLKNNYTYSDGIEEIIDDEDEHITDNIAKIILVLKIIFPKFRVDKIDTVIDTINSKKFKTIAEASKKLGIKRDLLESVDKADKLNSIEEVIIVACALMQLNKDDTFTMLRLKFFAS